MQGAIDFGALFELAPNAYMVLDRELRYVAANRAYVRLTGTPLGELLGKRIFDLFPNDPDDPGNEPARLLRRSLERVLASGREDHLAYIPYRVPRVDGGPPEERAWSATHVPLLDASGAVTHVLQHTVDVSALATATLSREAGQGDELRDTAGVLGRARAVQEENAALDREREHLRSLFEQAPGFMCVLDGPQHVFVLANDAYQRLVGDRNLIGASVATALPEVVAQGFVEVLDRVFRTGEPYVGLGVRVLLQRVVGAPEEEVFLDFVYQPVRGPDGSTRGIFVQGHDVTKRVTAERDNLESRRVAEAFSAELLAQSRAVEEALRAAGERIRELEATLATR